MLATEGGVVLKESGYNSERAKILIKSGLAYNVTLTAVDVVKSMNSYYKMQIIVPNDKKVFILYRLYGRIGTRRGKDTLV